jgi:hypothetical protein
MAVKSGKRELIDTGTDKRYVKRRKDGTFKESVDVGRSLAADRRSKSKTTAKPGYGDQGDQPKRSTKNASKKGSKSTTKKAGKKGGKK